MTLAMTLVHSPLCESPLWHNDFRTRIAAHGEVAKSPWAMGETFTLPHQLAHAGRHPEAPQHQRVPRRLPKSSAIIPRPRIYAPSELAPTLPVMAVTT